jgi:type II secretory pathway component GspD/PulD (secretin)
MNWKNILFTVIMLLTNVLLAKIQPIDDRPDESLINFNLKEDSLNAIVNQLAATKKINIFFPVAPDSQKILRETKVTFQIPYKITVDKAWEMATTMLDIAGFAVVQQQSNIYAIKPKGTIYQDSVPLYINTAVNLLPKSDLIIRYLYYFRNLNLQENSTKDNLTTILIDMLPGKDREQEQFFDLNKTYNTLLITGKSNIIKGIMKILHELDQGGFRESIEVVPIVHTNAHEIAETIQLLIPKKEEDSFRYPPVSYVQKERTQYFSSSTRIVSIDHTNSVAIFGLHDSVQRVKNFIYKHLDKKVDAEKTFLHIKPLQFLDAKEFAKTLQQMIDKQKEAVQARAETTERVLSDVIVVAEQLEPDETKDAGKDLSGMQDIEGEQQAPVIGGNNLIIACTQRDWKILDKLIDELDIEQWQVAVEVLIADMSASSANRLGTQIRRLANDTTPHELKWQSAQLVKPVWDNEHGIEADLLAQQPPNDPTSRITDAFSSGATIFSFKDNNGMSIITSLLREIETARIISQPFVITRNNEQATIIQSTNKYVRDKVDQQSKSGGSPIVRVTEVKAATQVMIRPRINKKADTINLELFVGIDNFIGNSNDTTKRRILTNANVGHKEVLVLGGISRMSFKESMRGCPILERIPIIGYLFKNQGLEIDHRNLIIFISPSRIVPVTGTDRRVNAFTEKKIARTSKALRHNTLVFSCPSDKKTLEESNFTCLEDPITNFLFSPKVGTALAGDMERFARGKVWEEEYLKEVWSRDNGNKKNSTTPHTTHKTVISHPTQKDVQQDEKLTQLIKKQENPFST